MVEEGSLGLGSGLCFACGGMLGNENIVIILLQIRVTSEISAVVNV